MATIFARIISSLFNYLMNYKVVFKKKNNKSFLCYYLLVIFQMFMSGLITNYFYTIIDNHVILIKIIIDSLIFIVNFLVQKYYIFVD